MKKSARWLSMIVFFLSACTPFDSLLYQPLQTGDTWLTHQPFTVVQLGTWNFILVQPSSTLFVYVLGVLTLAFGGYLIKNWHQQQAKLWWGIALLLWGMGALLAGTSYQAFSYEIKCAREKSYMGN